MKLRNQSREEPEAYAPLCCVLFLLAKGLRLSIFDALFLKSEDPLAGHPSASVVRDRLNLFVRVEMQRMSLGLRFRDEFGIKLTNNEICSWSHSPKPSKTSAHHQHNKRGDVYKGLQNCVPNI